MEPKILVAEAAEALGITSQALHNQLKRKQLKHQKSKNRVYFSHDTARLLLELRFEPSIDTFQIVKGGTGKTTVCLSFGVRASLYGARILLIDLDQQGNLTKACRVNASNKPIMIEIINQELPIREGIVPVCDGIDIIPSRIENALLDSNLMLKRLPLDHIYKDMLVPLKKQYDLILIDCPPALGSSVTAAALASDRVIAPVTPSEFSLEGLEITSKEIINISKSFKKIITLCPLLNEFDARNSLSHDTLRFLMTSSKYNKTLMRSAVRKCQEFENVITRGVSIFDSLSNSTAKEDIDLLTRELLKIGSFADSPSKKISQKEAVAS